MTPLSCSLIVRALAGPALMTPFPVPYSTSSCGSCVSLRPPSFMLSAGIAILVLVTAHETIPAWHSSLGSSPIGTLLICSRCFSEDAILRCFSVVTRFKSPLRMVLGVHVLLRTWYVLLFRVLASYSSDPTLALQSLTSPTWR